MTGVATLSARYLGTAIQFLVTIWLARSLGSSEFGYFSVVLGFATATAPLSAAGLTDGLLTVRHIRSRSISLSPSVLVYCSIGAIGQAALLAAGLAVFFQDAALALSVFGLGLAYSLAFTTSQLLVAHDAPNVGVTTYYLVPPLAMLLAIVTSELSGWNVTGAESALGLFAGGILTLLIGPLFYLLRRHRALSLGEGTLGEQQDLSVRLCITDGFPIAAVRALQMSFAWVPVWGAALTAGSTTAAKVALALRLLAVVSAGLAAVRFASRRGIASSLATGEAETIASSSRKVAQLSVFAAASAGLLAATVGPAVIASLFGAEFRASAILLSLACVGLLFEGCAGLSDEIVKALGEGTRLIRWQVSSLSLQIVVILATSHSDDLVGLSAILGYSGSVALLYLRIIRMASKRLGFPTWAFAVPRN